MGNVRVFHAIIFFLIMACPLIGQAALTGAWAGLSGAGAGTATVGAGTDAALGVSSNNAINANGGEFFTNTGATILGISSAYTSSSGNIVGQPALRFETRWDRNSNTDCDGTSTWTHTFSRPVYDPVLHMDRVGGNVNGTSFPTGPIAYSTLNTITTSPAGTVVERLSGVSWFEVSGNTYFRTPNVDFITQNNECTSDSRTTACGSMRISGLVESVTIFMEAHPDLSPNGLCGANSSAGDAMELIWEVNQDLADAPASYGDPVHAIRNSPTSGALHLGTITPDDELNSQHSGDANGDGAQDDGVTFPAYVTDAPTYTVPVTLTNTTGATATVCGWIDFNRNGTFDAGEQECNTVAPGAPLTNLTFDVSGFNLNGGANDYYARFRICSTASECTTPTGGAADGEVEDYLLPIDTLPVTLSSVSTIFISGKVKFDWSTSSELFNVGFQLWGLDGKDQKWDKLHGWLIRSGSGNAVEPQSYSKTVNVPKSINELIALGISSVDSDGSEHYYGPFNVGQVYGNLSTLKPIAWNHIRAQVDAQMVQRGYVKDRVNGYRKVSTQSSSTSATDSVIELGVRESGMYRITAQALLNAGIDWREKSKRDIALVDHNDNAVVRYVSAHGSGSGSTKTLGSKGEIYFYSPGVDAQAGLYTQTRVYRLVIDRYHALNGQYQRKQGITSGFSEYYRATSRVENDAQYQLTSAADDPWVDAVVVSYAHRTGSYAAAIPVEDDALWSQPSLMRLDLARNSSLRVVDGDGDGQIDPEHVVEGQILSSQGSAGLLALGSEQAVGKGDWLVEFEVPGNTPVTLINGKAVVGGIFSAGAGYAFSEVHVDAASLSYARPYVAKSGDDYLTFTGPDSGELGYDVTVPESGWPVVFAYNDMGALVRMAFESQTRVTGSDGARQRQVKLARLNGAGTQASKTQYWVSGKRGYLSVESLAVKSLASTSSLLAQAAGSNYLLIAHPMFMGPVLDNYASFKQSQGYRVSIIDYLQIVDVFGGGQTGPHGLTAYLKQVAAQGDVEHVLLVGGSSYDHTDKLGTGAMTFIPGHYGQSNYSKFTVSDVPYIAAANNDLFASIGRWPVRSVSDLQTIVDKSVAFSEADHSAGHVLTIAEHTVAGENIDFAAALNAMNPLVPSSWSTSEVHVDKVAKANNLILPGDLPQALSLAKTEIITELNKAPDVVLYNGHGTTSQLSNKGLFKSSDVASITAQGGEMWVPMSCYVTYYESTHVNTLAHQLMFKGNAVTISGAMLLSSQNGNIAAGKSILDHTLNDHKSIGEALNAHKMQSGNASLNINWALLGDPTLRF